MEKDLRPYLAQIFINFSKRSIKLLDNEGYEQTVEFKFDEEGAEGFAETIGAHKKNETFVYKNTNELNEFL